MPEIVADIVINAPAAAVLDFATTPANWPRFWPITLSVSGDVERPAAVGARWTEQVRIAFWRGEFHWQATERVDPTSFTMIGRSQGHGWLGRLLPSEPGRIAYTLTERGGQTHFHRVMDYPDPNLFLKLMDVLVMRRAMTRAIDTALHGLKAIMESAPARPQR
jgi:uncharacterized protein YndB with AHSA1/START domain